METTANELQSVLSMAMFIAKVIHDAIDGFDFKHLSVDQRRELDSVINNAVYTALYASKHYSQSSAAKAFVTVGLANIPKHWVKPKPLDAYRRLEELYKERRIQDSTPNEIAAPSKSTEAASPLKSKDDLVEAVKYKGYEIRVFKYPWEPTYFFTATFADNGKAKVANTPFDDGEEYADAATAIRKTKAAINEYLRKKGKPKGPRKRETGTL
jgi:hypothetical protein